MKRKAFPFCLSWLGLPWQHATDWVASITGICFSHYWRLGIQDQGVGIFGSWWELSSRLPPSCCVLTRSLTPPPPSWSPTILTSSKSTYFTKILPPNTILFGGSDFNIGIGGRGAHSFTILSSLSLLLRNPWGEGAFNRLNTTALLQNLGATQSIAFVTGSKSRSMTSNPGSIIYLLCYLSSAFSFSGLYFLISKRRTVPQGL